MAPLAALERLFVSHVNRRQPQYEFHRLDPSSQRPVRVVRAAFLDKREQSFRMKLLAALQKEARKLTKVRVDVERQLNAISAAVKAFGSTLATESANGRKKRGRRKGLKMSAASRKAIAEAQRKRWAKIHAAKKAG